MENNVFNNERIIKILEYTKEDATQQGKLTKDNAIKSYYLGVAITANQAIKLLKGEL